MTTTATTARERMLLAKAASRSIGLLSDADKRDVLLAIADAIDSATAEIVSANGERPGAGSCRPDSRSPCRIACAWMRPASPRSPRPSGTSRNSRTRSVECWMSAHCPTASELTKVSVPFGVVGSIYEARPNVTVDIAALALRSGNAVVLRGGSAAELTNAALVRAMRGALAARGIDPEAIQTVDDFGRDGARELMHARGIVDVLVPRGSAQLIETVVTESSVPVIETGAGVVHIVLDESAPLEWARDIVVNAKVQRPSVCNSVETVLVHRGAAERLVPAVVSALGERGVTVHGDPEIVRLVDGVVPATDEDWSTEYLSLDIAMRVVDGSRRSPRAHPPVFDAPHRVDHHPGCREHRALPRRGRLRRRDGERVDSLHRRGRVRLRCRGRHLHAEAARPRTDGTRRAHEYEVARAGFRTSPALTDKLTPRCATTRTRTEHV